MLLLSSFRRLALSSFAVLIGAACGCAAEGDDFVPVAGNVTLDSKTLTLGSVAFHPDSSKGNNSMHIPIGEINKEGKFELVTIGRKGAPIGWYKVLVYADANTPTDPNASRPPTPKWMMNEKYTEKSTTPLSVEVVEKPAPGAYDLNVTK